MSTARTYRRIPLLIRGSRDRLNLVEGTVWAITSARLAWGVWCANTSSVQRDCIKAWKRSFPYDATQLAEFADQTAALILEWAGGVFVAGTVATVPPRGASLFGVSSDWPYAAGLVAQAVAARIGLPFVSMLERSSEKRKHGPWHSIKQTPYTLRAPDPLPTVVLVTDDLVTSGATMKLSLAAIRAAGIPAFGFAYNGHG